MFCPVLSSAVIHVSAIHVRGGIIVVSVVHSYFLHYKELPSKSLEPWGFKYLVIMEVKPKKKDKKIFYQISLIKKKLKIIIYCVPAGWIVRNLGRY